MHPRERRNLKTKKLKNQRTGFSVSQFLSFLVPSKTGGYTLIELLVYGVIFSLFLLLATQVFITIKTMTANSFVMVSFQQNYARVFSDFNQTIRAAQSVTSPAPGTSDSSLSLNSGSVVYQVQNGVLQKTENGDASDLTDSGVSIGSVSFSNLSETGQTASIKIQMTVNSNYVLEGGRVFSEEIQTTVGLR